MQTCEATLEERIGFAADDSPYLTGSDISIEPDTRRVVVRGVVRSYYEKQMAQVTLLRVDGVEAVDNHLEVLRRRLRLNEILTLVATQRERRVMNPGLVVRD